MTSPLRISVFDGAYQPLDWVGRPLSVTGTLRFDKASTVSIVLDSDDEQIGQLVAPGARLVLEYFADPAAPTTATFAVSGAVDERTGVGGSMGTRTFGLVDDWAYVMSILGFPNPTGTITQQGDDAAEYTVSGSAETVVKTLVSLNATRLGLPITCATDQHRGSSISVSIRMVPLLDRLYPAVTQAGIGVTVQQSGAGLVVDCFVPTVRTDVLTEVSGVVIGGTWTQRAPTVTRVVEAGGGEGTARVFRLQIDSAAELAWGTSGKPFVREASLDCRDTSDSAVMDARGLATLTAGAATSLVQCELAETQDFRVGVSAWLGDTLSIQLAGAPEILGTVTEVGFSFVKDEGPVLTPRVGEVNTTFAQQVSSALVAVAARQHIIDMGR